MSYSGKEVDVMIFSNAQNRQIEWHSGKPSHYLFKSGRNALAIEDMNELHYEMFNSGYEYLHVGCYKEQFSEEVQKKIDGSKYFILIYEDECNKLYVLEWYAPFHFGLIDGG